MSNFDVWKGHKSKDCFTKKHILSLILIWQFGWILVFLILLSLCLSTGEKGPVPSLFDQKTSTVSGFDQQQPPVKVVYYRAVYPFDARSHDEISIAPGDVIMVCYIHKLSTYTLVFLRRPSCYKYTGWWRTENREQWVYLKFMSSRGLQYKQ